MTRRQMNIRLDDRITRLIKRVKGEYNMSESQVISWAIILLEQKLELDAALVPPVQGRPAKKVVDKEGTDA